MTTLCTPADVRTYLGLTEVQAADAMLQPLCDAADAFVLSYLNRPTLAVTTYTETYHGTGSSTIVPHQRPLRSVSSVVVGGTPQAPATGQGAGFVYDDLAIYLRHGVFCRGVKNVQLTYEAGFETVPADIVRAAIDIVSEKYMKRTRVGVASKSIGQESISYRADDVTPFAAKALRQYRLVGLVSP